MHETRPENNSLTVFYRGEQRFVYLATEASWLKRSVTIVLDHERTVPRPQVFASFHKNSEFCALFHQVCRRSDAWTIAS